MQLQGRLLRRLEITVLAIMLRCTCAFRNMIIHRVLLLLTDLAVRTAEIFVCLFTLAARTCLFAGFVSTTHLRIACEAITNILGRIFGVG